VTGQIEHTDMFLKDIRS